MKPETNLFLRALIGEKKSRLLEETARIPLRGFPEAADRIIQINQELKALNSAFSELNVLSPETVKIIRRSLEVHKDAAETILATVAAFASGEVKETAEAKVSSACRALDEFNAVYPEEVRK